MKTSALLTLGTTSLVILLSTTYSWAATGGKGTVDRQLIQAIEKTAETQAQPEPEPEPVVEAPAVVAAPVVAEVAPEPEPVEEIEPPVKGLGFRTGSFLWLPSLALTQAYDDNVQAASANAEDDFYTVVSPMLQVELTDSQHEMILKAAYEANRYWDKSDEDNDNINASLAGHLDAGTNWQVPYSFSYGLNHEAREDDLTRQLPTERIEERTIGAESGLAFTGEKFKLSLLGRYKSEEFENDRTPAGVDVIRSDADRFDYEADGRIGFNVAEGHSLYAGGIVGVREYDRRNHDGTGFNGIVRDSDRFAGYLGWQADIEGKLFSDIKVGYEEREYDDNSIENISDMFVNADVNWLLAQNTNLNFNLDYGHYEDDEVTDPILRTVIGTMIEQGFGESILVGLGAEYEMKDFQGINREDEAWVLSALADYMINQNISVGAEYNFQTRESDLSALEYDRNLFMLRLTGRL